MSTEILDSYEDLVSRLVRNKVDNIEIIAHGRCFDLDVSSYNDFTSRRILLLRRVILEICKISDSTTDKYNNLLVKVNQLLKEKRLSSAKLYDCQVLGCLYKTSRHREYIEHIRKIHASSDRFFCNFKKSCRRNYQNIFELEEHVKKEHWGQATVSRARTLVQEEHFDSVSCKCNMLSCGEKTFTSVRKLASHVNTFHFKEPRCCMFDGCKKSFNVGEVSRNHFRLKHFNSNNFVLKSVHLAPSQSDPSYINDVEVDELKSTSQYDNGESFEVRDDGYHEDCDVREVLSEPAEDDLHHHFLRSYCDFLNRLINVHFISVSTVQIIAKQYLEQAKQAVSMRAESIKWSLRKHLDLDEEKVRIITDDVEEDPFLRAQELLSSEYKFNSFLDKNFAMIRPVEIVLNPQEVQCGYPKDVIHYVPIVPMLKSILEDESFRKAMKLQAEEFDRSDEFRDVMDGGGYRNNAFFIENPNAMCLMMYSDGVEITNPLASGRGKHKITQVFWQLANIPRYQRSNVDRFQLALVFKEKLLKKYKYDTIFKQLIDDLQILETDGVDVEVPFKQNIKAGLLLYSGDNLESHLVGGFSASFSSKDVCRHCHIQYENLQDHIHNFDGEEPHKSWTIEEFDSHLVDEIESPQSNFNIDLLEEREFEDVGMPIESESDYLDESDDEEASATDYGVKWNCPFNVLKAFHCVTSMPPDIMHDLLGKIS